MNGAIETTIDSGNGADTILNYLAVQVDDDGNATDFYYNSNNVSINGGNGDDYIENMGAFGTIEGGLGNDTIKNFGFLLVDQNGNIIRTIPISNYYYQINAEDGNNFVYNENACATITSGTGADLIENIADTVSINAGDGSNTIANTGSTVTIQSGAGNDSIASDGSDVIIFAGAGNDSINNYASNVTIDSGDGNDIISLGSDAQNNVIEYRGDEGNDVIYGCNSTTTIKISGYDPNITRNGNDIIVKIGDNTLTLKNASGVPNSNIFRENNNFIVGTNGADKIHNTLEGATIQALGGNDYISNIADNVSIDAGNESDTIYNDASNVTINLGDGNDSIHNDTMLLEEGIGSKNPGNYVTIDGGKGNDTITSCGANNVSINAGEGNDVINGDLRSSTTVMGGKGNDTIELYSTGKNRLIQYIEGDDNDVIFYFGTTDTLQIGDGSGTYSSQIIGSDIIVSVGSGKVTLVGVANLSNINIFGTDASTPTWTLSGTTAIYGTWNKTFATVNGVKSTDGIIVDTNNKTVTLKADNLDSSNVTFSSNADGYSFALDGVNPSTSTNAHFSGNTYKSASNTAGYSVSYDKKNIVYTAPVAESDLFSLSGVKSTNGIVVDTNKKIVTLKADNLDSSNVTFSSNAGGYSFALSGVDSSSSTAAHFDGLTFKSASSSEGYSLSSDKKSINYTAPVIESDLFSLSNVKNTDSISIDTAKKTVTLNAANLNKKEITISDGYTLKLAEDVLAPVETTEGWSKVSSGKATYNFDSTTAGYTLADNKITYTKAVAAKSFTLTGIKSTSGITVDDSTVTLNVANLNKKEITISDGYTLKLANDVPTSTTKTAGAFTKFKSGTATFKTTSYSDYYSLKNNQVIYTAPSGGKAITIENLKSSATLDEIKSAIAVVEQKNGSYKITFKNADVLTTKVPTISASGVTYSVALDKSLKPANLAPDWKVSGTNASLKSDTSAGYTVSDNKIIYSKKVTGAPQLILGGLVKNSSLSAPVKKIVTLDSKILGTNSSLKSNDGSYTVKLTGNMAKKTFTGSANADTLNIAANNAAVLGGAGNDSFTVSGSKVTLTGGKGNDSFKLSGKNPVLIYAAGDGNDSVNFVAGMHISLSGSTQIKTLGKSDSDLLLGFGKNSSVKVTGAKSTDTIKVSDASRSVTLIAGKFDLANSLTFNSKNSSVTVDKNFTSSLAPSDDVYLGGSKLSSVATINASNVTSSITVNGNDKANFIFGGKNNDEIFGGNGNDSIVGNAGNDKLYGQNGNDTLQGGAGNDSLWGGAGNDFFIFEAGKDVIADFTAGQDKIKIAKGKISKSTLSGSDVVFTIGKGSLTVKNAKGKTITLLDSTGKASSTVVGAQALTNSNKASVTIGADMGFVDSSARTKAIKITGNALANTISGGTKNDSIFGAAGNDSIFGNAGNDKLYGDAGNDILLGGKGNDSLWGGAGNDSLWGDAGNDTFFYTANEGTDKIFDYETGDLLKILNADGSNGSFKSSKYSGGDLTLTINGGGKIIFEDVASNTKFNINGSSYHISGAKLVKK